LKGRSTLLYYNDHYQKLLFLEIKFSGLGGLSSSQSKLETAMTVGEAQGFGQ